VGHKPTTGSVHRHYNNQNGGHVLETDTLSGAVLENLTIRDPISPKISLYRVKARCGGQLI